MASPLTEEVIFAISAIAKNEDKDRLRKKLDELLSPQKRVWENESTHEVESVVESIKRIVDQLAISEQDKTLIMQKVNALIPCVFGEGVVVFNHDFNLLWAHLDSLNRAMAKLMNSESEDSDSQEERSLQMGESK